MRISIIGWREGRKGDRGNEGMRAARYNGIVHTQLITAHSYACDREWGSQAVTAVGPFHLPANLSYVPILPSTAYHCCYCNLQIAAANDRKSSRTEENERLNLYDLCLQFQLAGRRKTYEAHPSFRAASCLVLWTVIPFPFSIGWIILCTHSLTSFPFSSSSILHLWYLYDSLDLLSYSHLAYLPISVSCSIRLKAAHRPLGPFYGLCSLLLRNSPSFVVQYEVPVNARRSPPPYCFSRLSLPFSAIVSKIQLPFFSKTM